MKNAKIEFSGFCSLILLTLFSFDVLNILKSAGGICVKSHFARVSVKTKAPVISY